MTELSPFSRQIWEAKYRFGGALDRPPEADIAASWDRVARALAAVEEKPDDWQQRFRAALEGFHFLPAGRILAGAGALGAENELMEVAELLGGGVAKALLGKAVLPDDLPYVTGAIGLLGTRPSWKLMSDCDTLLVVGSSFPYSEWLPKEGQAKAIQIDIDGKMLSIRYPVDVNLHGDSKETLQALIPLLKRKEDRSWRKTIEDEITSWWKLLQSRAENEADPVNPQRVFWELSPHLPDNCILTSDSGSAANWFARDLMVRKGMMASLSGNLATMGPGVPYAVAAKFAFPERMVIAMVGDGAMQMNGNNGLMTIAKYWKEWANPGLVVLALNNNDLNQVTWEQRVLSGDPKFEGSQNVPVFNYAQYAETLGLKGVRIEKPAWQAALHADRPVVVDALTDPNVPPLPPHIRFDQAKAYIKALFKGDPEQSGMLKQTFKDTIEKFLPH